MNTHGNVGKALSRKFGSEMNMTYQEIAQELGVSFQAIQQTEAKALQKFEKNFELCFLIHGPLSKMK